MVCVLHAYLNTAVPNLPVLPSPCSLTLVWPWVVFSGCLGVSHRPTRHDGSVPRLPAVFIPGRGHSPPRPYLQLNNFAGFTQPPHSRASTVPHALTHTPLPHWDGTDSIRLWLKLAALRYGALSRAGLRLVSPHNGTRRIPHLAFCLLLAGYVRHSPALPSSDLIAYVLHFNMPSPPLFSSTCIGRACCRVPFSCGQLPHLVPLLHRRPHSSLTLHLSTYLVSVHLPQVL